MTDYPLHERARRATHIAKYLAAHPREARMMPRWYRERASSPFELRRPWWPYPVPGFLRRSLPPAPRAFEYGTGGSTMWLADLGATITSVEHDSSWYELVRTHVGPAADVILRAPRAGGRLYSEVDDHRFDGGDRRLPTGVVRSRRGRRAMPRRGAHAVGREGQAGGLRAARRLRACRLRRGGVDPARLARVPLPGPATGRWHAVADDVPGAALSRDGEDGAAGRLACCSTSSGPTGGGTRRMHSDTGSP